MASVPGPRDETVEIHEWMTWLRVRADLGIAMMVLGRHNGDLEGRPVGLFHASLRAEEIAKMRELVETTKWAQLAPPTGGDVTASVLSIDYARGSLLIRREFNAQSREFIAAIWPLMESINGQMSAMLAAPAAALVVSVRAVPDPSDANIQHLFLYLSNPGSIPVVIVDPRVPTPSGEPRARLKFTAASQDPRPPTWTPIALPPLPEGQPELLTVAPGAHFELSVPWQAPRPGSYYLRGEWLDYQGPPSAPEHPPVMPLAEDIGVAQAKIGPYVVRGAAFSPGVPFDASGERP